MRKFKIGDRVVGNKWASEEYTITKEGVECEVVGVYGGASKLKL